MAKDNLKLFANKSTCSACGCIDSIGSFRCTGCGSFHSNTHLIDREAPPPEDRYPDDLPAVDPSAYSIGPNQKILEESFEQSDDVTTWNGGSTDFSFQEDEGVKNLVAPKGDSPPPEEL